MLFLLESTNVREQDHNATIVLEPLLTLDNDTINLFMGTEYVSPLSKKTETKSEWRPFVCTENGLFRCRFTHASKQLKSK